MSPSRILTTVTLAAVLVAPTFAQRRCVWGSFAQSRINYPGGHLTGAQHSNLRGIITANGGTIGTAAPTLTTTYLNGIDVFYTSLLSTRTGTLSTTEQAALRTWITAGGTLVVSGDIFPLPAYESFTKQFGVTGWTRVSKCRVNGSVVANHAITAGITSFHYCTESVFTVPTTGKLLGKNSTGGPFLCVQEKATGFPLTGRILTIGDHNMFANSYINIGQNRALAANIVKWSCRVCNVTASWANYGTGYPGRLGVPTFTSSAPPKLGTTITLASSSSSGGASAGILIFGVAKASIPTPFGGTLLVAPLVLANVPIPASGFNVPVAIANDRGLCGGNLFLQIVQLDAGAKFNLSFTRGLQLTLGN